MNDPTSSKDTPPGWMLIFVAWIVVASATLGSLFFSEVMGVPVCILCWYQRIALYPLTFILAVGLFPYDPKVVRYTGVLTGMGWLSLGGPYRRHWYHHSHSVYRQGCRQGGLASPDRRY
ncbi:MAG: disulfide bond formation protein B [Magnetococcales bacterium]|nr:disulfide bond formation protein B [Magnetococcales bacterium]